jgi:hypothetical protein
MKLCKDCKHFRSEVGGRFVYLPATCAHPSLIEVELVRGRDVYKDTSLGLARVQRKSGECGKDAVMWEPKPAPWWKVWS